jgi:hypothetical protein
MVFKKIFALLCAIFKNKFEVASYNCFLILKLLTGTPFKIPPLSLIDFLPVFTLIDGCTIRQNENVISNAAV